jgi:hypothetical protein
MMRVRCSADFRLAGWGLLVGAILLSAGCGAPSGTVSGKVTVGGKTVPGGTVSFIPPDGKNTQFADIAEDGSYSVKNLPLGKVSITVETKSVAPLTAPGGVNMHMPAGAPNAPNADAAKRYVKIPDKYSQAESSGLSYEVKSGRQEHPIELAEK